MNNYNELLILIKKHNPLIICLQETHLKNTINIPVPIHFKLYQSENSNNSYGGSALIIHDSVQHEPINLTSSLEVVAQKIHSKITFNIFSTYISPSTKFNISELDQTFDCPNTPSLITGDFNSWHQDWGSKQTNKKGKIVQHFITQSQFILLNDKSPTHLSTHNTLTHIDLTFASPEISIDSTWKTETDLFGSDHYPIIINLFITNTQQSLVPRKPKFITKNANWEKYQMLSKLYNDNRPISTNINKETANIQKIILMSANQSVPQTKCTINKKTVPWWNSKLEQLKKK